MTETKNAKRRKLIRDFRTKSGLTLVELGKLADVSQPMLSQFENGSRNLSEDAWRRLAVAMEKTKQERKNSARLESLWEELRPVVDILESSGEVKQLRTSDVARAMGAIYVARAMGKLPPPEPSGLKRALIPHPFYKSVADAIAKERKEEAERGRQLKALENLRSVDDPIVAELIESFRREIAEKNKLLEAMSRTVEEK